MPDRYRTNPAEIEAMLLTEDNLVEAADWVSDTGTRCDQYSGHLIVHRPVRGNLPAGPGVWLVRTSGGAWHTSPTRQFEELYERIEHG